MLKAPLTLKSRLNNFVGKRARRGPAEQTSAAKNSFQPKLSRKPSRAVSLSLSCSGTGVQRYGWIIKGARSDAQTLSRCRCACGQTPALAMFLRSVRLTSISIVISITHIFAAANCCQIFVELYTVAEFYILNTVMCQTQPTIICMIDQMESTRLSEILCFVLEAFS